MSLKAFHIFFIVASIALAFGFAAWSVAAFVNTGRILDLLFGLLALASGVILIFYAKYVLKKLKHVSYL